MPGHFDRLITFIEGPVLDEFGIWDDQREYLLTIALGYRAFTERALGVNLDDFRELAWLLIEGALGTEPDERVDDELRTIADWLHEALPEVSQSPESDGMNITDRLNAEPIACVQHSSFPATRTLLGPARDCCGVG